MSAASSSPIDHSSTATLEGELRELIIKLQQSFTQLIQPQSTLVGESHEEKNALEDTREAANLERELTQLLDAAGGVSTTTPSSIDKQKVAPQRKALPVQKVSYSQLQTSAMKQSYQTTVHANNLVHHAQSLLGLVGRLKLSVLLAQSSQDRTRQEVSAPHGADESENPHPLSSVHPSTIPPHHFPLHLQRTQQQLHDSALELHAQMNQLEREVEEKEWRERRIQEIQQQQVEMQL